MVEYLLQNGADVNAKDKGGLIPLHNAASYGVSSCNWLSQIRVQPFSLSPPPSPPTPCPQHVDVAGLLIKYNSCMNATDRWNFTPLHEAAQKGRTQLCALLVTAVCVCVGVYKAYEHVYNTVPVYS